MTRKKKVITKPEKTTPVPKKEVLRGYSRVEDIPGYTSKFRKKKVTYKIGDRVEILYAEEKYQGILSSILGSQVVIMQDNGLHKFFFQSGLNIKKVK